MHSVHRIRCFDYVPSGIQSVACQKNFLLVGRDSGYVELWSLESKVFCLFSTRITEPEDLRTVKWCTYGGETAFCVTTLSGQLFIYLFPSMRFATTGPSFGGAIWDCAVSPSQDKIAIACDDTSVRIFDLQHDLNLVLKTDSFTTKCLSVCWGKDGQLFAGDSNGKIAQIDPETGRFTSTISLDPEVSVWTLVMTDNGSLVSGDSDGKVTFWDPATGTQTDQFSSQADILTVATRGNLVFASGIDPQVSTYFYSDDTQRWVFQDHYRTHTHDVNSLTTYGNSFISGSKDSAFAIRKTLIYPFQNKPGYAVGKISTGFVCVGATTYGLSVWRIDGEKAILDLKVKTEDPVECLAISSDTRKITYSTVQGATRTLEFNGNQWSYSKDERPPSSCLCYCGDVLYSGDINGGIYSNDSMVTVPGCVTKMAASERYLAVSTIDSVYILQSSFEGETIILPSLGAPVSSFQFMPSSSVLGLVTSDNNIYYYDIEKREVTNKITVNKLGPVAANTIEFIDGDKVAVASSSAVVIKKATDESYEHKLDYQGILFFHIEPDKEIVISEMPWLLILKSMPLPFRVKRFATKKEGERIKY